MPALLLPPPTPAERRAPSLVALRDVATAAAAIELGACDHDPTCIDAAAAQLRALLSRALELLALVQEAEDPAPPDPFAPQPVGDVCFASTLELNRALRELGAARAPDDTLVAAETAHRKLRRGIRAVLEAARELGDPDILGGEHQGRHQVADLASALVVRRLYAAFRRGLRRATDDSPEAILAAVRYAGGALAILVTSPDYTELRASDRTVLRRLRERVLTWARADRGAASGAHVLEDVWTTADLLRGINQRQELRAHDAALLALPPTDLARLEPLVGLDDELDRLLDAARTDATLLPALASRLALLR